MNFSSDVPNPRSEINSKDCCFACKCGFSTSVDNDMKGKKANAHAVEPLELFNLRGQNEF